jgi:hypothetical protein
MGSRLVAGETVDDIGRVLQQIRARPDDDGMVHVTARLQPHEAVPFERALMRIEAEFLQADADELELAGLMQRRTHEQRLADAFAELIRRFGVAVNVALPSSARDRERPEPG